MFNLPRKYVALSDEWTCTNVQDKHLFPILFNFATLEYLIIQNLIKEDNFFRYLKSINKLLSAKNRMKIKKDILYVKLFRFHWTILQFNSIKLSFNYRPGIKQTTLMPYFFSSTLMAVAQAFRAALVPL